MNEMVKMVVVLTVLSCVSGGSLAFLRQNTAQQIEYQQLKFVKGPAILSILKGITNNPIENRFKIKDGNVERSFYVGVAGGQPKYVAFESSGGGFGGPVGLMIGVDLTTDKILGVGVTTHSETPGVGARAKTDPDFVAQFSGRPFKGEFKVTADGGQIDALSGATVTSRGVCAGVTEAIKVYERLKEQIKAKAQAFE